MNLRAKFLTILILPVVLCVIALWFLKIDSSQKTALVLKNTKTETERFFNKMLDKDAEPIRAFVYDMTFWDDMVTFVKSADPEFGRVNLDESIGSFDGDFAWVFHPDFTLSYECSVREDMTRNPVLDATILERAFTDDKIVHYYHNSPAGLLEIHGASIHPSDDEDRITDPSGYFLVGRLWDSEYQQGLGDFIGGVATLYIENETSALIPLNPEHQIQLSKLLEDWDGQSSALLQVNVPVPFLKHFSKATSNNLMLVTLFVTLLILFFICIFHRWIELPLTRITQSLNMQESACVQDLSLKADEFGQIAKLVEESIERRNVLKQEKEAAETGLFAKNLFIAHISHELRTPMNGILGNSQLLEDTPLSGEQKEYIDALNTSAECMLLRVNELINVAAAYADDDRNEEQHFDLNHLVVQTADKWRKAAGDKKLELAHSTCPKLTSRVKGSTMVIGGVLDALLSNAVKFTVDGNITIETLTTYQNENRVDVHIAVSDTGIGIPEEIKCNIFEPFTQADESFTREYQGIGIGLTTARHLVEHMNGRIDFKSSSETGTVFNVYLKLNKHAAQVY
jgi:signal transduction histidine kinase